MSLFLPNIPTSSQNLDFSQGQLLSNNQGLDTVFGIDHYKFSDATSNKGFHNTITQPPYQNPAGTIASAIPVTTTSPIIYCFQPLTAPNGTPTTKLGLLQYSLPTPNDATTNPYGNAIPTPLTNLQSPGAGISIGMGASTPVLDFAGITVVAIATLHAYDTVAKAVGSIDVFWNGTAFSFNNYSPVASVFGAIGASSVLKLQNLSGSTNYTSTFWVLIFHRIQP